MVVRLEASLQLERKAHATHKVCDEARRILLEADRNVAKHFPEGSHMEPHERSVAARALLVGPTRLLAKLVDDAHALATHALDVGGGLQAERFSAREAADSTLHALHWESEAQVACLREELVQCESDADFSLGVLLAERRARSVEVDGLCALLDDEREATAAANARYEQERARADELLVSLEAMKRERTRAEADHAHELSRRAKEHADALTQLQRERQLEVQSLTRRIDALTEEKEKLRRDASASRLGMALRLRASRLERAKAGHAAALEAARLEDERRLLELRIERERREAEEREMKMHRQQSEATERMSFKLHELTKMQAEMRSYWEALRTKAAQGSPLVGRALVTQAIEQQRRELEGMQRAAAAGGGGRP